VSNDGIGVPALRETSVPERLVDGIRCTPVLEASADAILLSVPRVGRFLVRADEPGLVERAPGAADEDVACFREGPVAAAFALLRGALVLHAASVAVRGKAVAVCGLPAAGKSAVAAALARRGHTMLADAVTVVADDDSHLVALVSPDPVLWPDSARQLGLDESRGRRLRAGLAARAYRLGPNPFPAPLSHVVLLRVDPLGAGAAATPVRGAAKLKSLIRASWYRDLLERLGRSNAHLHGLMRLSADVSCVELRRPPRGTAPARLAELVEEIVT
jgi:hypothetical protein